MAAKVAAGASPWIGGWNRLVANPHASLSYAPNPQVVVSRGNDGVHPDNSGALFNDVAAAYQCALRWKVSGNTAYADKAVQIMNAWASTLTAIYGTTALNGDMDGVLMAGIQGYQFANAGEIMRTYPGWAAADFAAFQRMMSGLFYPVNHGFITATGGLDPILIYSNWDLCSIASILAIGVLCDDKAKFDEAIAYFQSGRGNGAIAQTVYYLHPGHLGQTQESGRDQGHDTLSVALLSAICEMAWNQGVDLYGYRNNLALSAFEYVARGNLIASGTTYYTVPFTTYRNHQVTDTVFSTAGQGAQRPHWAIAYHHFANRQGIAAPYSKAFALLMSPEGGGGDYGSTSGGFDQLGFTTLTHWRDPISSGAAPSGLTARLIGGAVQLSWWGGVYADSYSVERAAAAAGPYTTIASGITDPRTWTDTPTPGPWYYRVRQRVAGVDGAVSNVATVQTALTPLLRLAMNEGSGTVAADGTGNGFNGTLTGGTSWTTGPKAGTQAVAFDGTSGSIVLPADLTVDLGDFTIATWAWWNGGNTDACVFWLGRDNNQYLRLTPHDVSRVLRFGITVNGYDAEQTAVTTTEMPYGRWVHLAVTLSGSTATVYLDGVVAAMSTAVALAPFRFGSTSLNSLGRRAGGATPWFNGKLSDFRIYFGAMSAAQVAALYAA